MEARACRKFLAANTWATKSKTPANAGDCEAGQRAQACGPSMRRIRRPCAQSFSWRPSWWTCSSPLSSLRSSSSSWRTWWSGRPWPWLEPWLRAQPRQLQAQPWAPARRWVPRRVEVQGQGPQQVLVQWHPQQTSQPPVQRGVFSYMPFPVCVERRSGCHAKRVVPVATIAASAPRSRGPLRFFCH